MLSYHTSENNDDAELLLGLACGPLESDLNNQARFLSH